MADSAAIAVLYGSAAAELLLSCCRCCGGVQYTEERRQAKRSRAGRTRREKIPLQRTKRISRRAVRPEALVFRTRNGRFGRLALDPTRFNFQLRHGTSLRWLQLPTFKPLARLIQSSLSFQPPWSSSSSQGVANDADKTKLIYTDITIKLL